METELFNKLEKLNSGGPLGERVYQEIKRVILEGLFPPGSILPEDQLTSALGISRTPVREALTRLKGEGLVIVIPRKGARVLEVDQKELEELIEVREVFETTFFNRTMKNIPRDEFKKIRNEFQRAEERMVAAEHDMTLWRRMRTEYLNIDFDFHRRLISATGNRLWIDHYEKILDLIKFYSNYTIIKNPAFHELSRKEHYDILDAILAGDFSDAKWLLRKHIRGPITTMVIP